MLSVQEKMYELRELLLAKETELLEDIESAYRPLTSKLEAITSEYQRASKRNDIEEQYIDGLLDQELSEKANGMRPLRIMVVNTNIVESVKEKFSDIEEADLESGWVRKGICLLGTRFIRNS